MPRSTTVALLSAIAAVAAMGTAHAHDVTRPLDAFDPNAKIEEAARSFHETVATAEAAGVDADALDTARFVVWVDLAWSNHDISVCFWNGTEELQNFIMNTAKVWSDNADLNFVYKTDGKNNICRDNDPTSADIRINLDPDAPLALFVNQEGNAEGAWSYLGRVALNEKYLVTMNLRDIAESRTENPLWTTHAIRHEFGHALALMHEHQRDLCDAWFDYDKTAKLYGWSVEETKQQVGKFADSEIQYLSSVGDYDVNSIMQYNFRKEQFKDVPGKKNPCLRETPIDNLSPQDIEGIQVLYGPPAGAAAMMNKRSGAEPAMIPAKASKADVAAARNSLQKKVAEMPADPVGTGRSGTGTPGPKAALNDVVASIKQLEALIPPRE